MMTWEVAERVGNDLRFTVCLDAARCAAYRAWEAGGKPGEPPPPPLHQTAVYGLDLAKGQPSPAAQVARARAEFEALSRERWAALVRPAAALPFQGEEVLP